MTVGTSTGEAHDSYFDFVLNQKPSIPEPPKPDDYLKQYREMKQQYERDNSKDAPVNEVDPTTNPNNRITNDGGKLPIIAQIEPRTEAQSSPATTLPTPSEKRTSEAPIESQTPSNYDPNQALNEAKAKYPILNTAGDIVVSVSPASEAKGRMLEYWGQGKGGDSSFPRPSELPVGKTGIQLFGNVAPKDIAADVVSHQLVKTDPILSQDYAAFTKTFDTPEGQARLKEDYAYAQKNEGEKRPFEQWKEQTRIPAYFRGYVFDQWSPEERQHMFTKDQATILDRTKRYVSSDPIVMPPENPAGPNEKVANVVRGVAKSAVELAMIPGKVSRGEMAPDSDEAIRGMFDLATLIGTGGVGTAGLRASSLGIFGGRLGAANLPTERKILGGVKAIGKEDLLKTAERMFIDEGAHPADIYRKTGWFLGPDNKWRFEISDKGARLKTENLKPMAGEEDKPSWTTANTREGFWFHSPASLFEKDKTVGDILEHPELFKVYPELKDIKLVYPGFSMDVQGFYNSEKNIMGLAANKGEVMLSTLLHELQHAVQTKEGFTPGGNVQEWISHPELLDATKKGIDLAKKALEDNFENLKLKDPFLEKYDRFDIMRIHNDYLSNSTKKLSAHIAENYPDLYEKLKILKEASTNIGTIEDRAFEKYRSIFGEAEARSVQERQRLTSEERKQLPPWEGSTFKNLKNVIVKERK